MKLLDKPLYAYRIYTHSHAFKVLSPCSTIENIWEEIEVNSILDFQYPDVNGVIIDISIRCRSIEAIDNPYGTEPVSRLDGPGVTEKVTNRAVSQGGKIILGQKAKKVDTPK